MLSHKHSGKPAQEVCPGCLPQHTSGLSLYQNVLGEDLSSCSTEQCSFFRSAWCCLIVWRHRHACCQGNILQILIHHHLPPDFSPQQNVFYDHSGQSYVLNHCWSKPAVTPYIQHCCCVRCLHTKPTLQTLHCCSWTQLLLQSKLSVIVQLINHEKWIKDKRTICLPPKLSN